MKFKSIVLLTFIGLLNCAASAGGDHEHDGHPSPTPCPNPALVAGPRGPAGQNGQNYDDKATFIGGADVRLLDSKHMDFHLFDDYDLRRGRNDSFGFRIGFKIGRSYEEELIEQMKKQIEELRSIAHRPGIHQENFYPEFEKGSKDFWLKKREE